MNTYTLSHANDPQVSRDAIEAIPAVTSHRVMQIIAELIDTRGPMTPTELETVYHREAFINDWPMVALRSVAKRASEMKTIIGVLAGTGVRRERAEALDLVADLVTVETLITDYWERAS